MNVRTEVVTNPRSKVFRESDHSSRKRVTFIVTEKMEDNEDILIDGTISRYQKRGSATERFR